MAADLPAEPPEFKAWLSDLIRLAPEYMDTKWDDWEGYFLDGYTPQHAIEADNSYD